MRKYQKHIALGLVIFMMATLLLGSLAGCTANDPLANQFKAGDNKNYIAGDGSVTEFAKANRGEAVVWSGQTESGEALSSTQLRGVDLGGRRIIKKKTPCRAEAPDLVALAKKYPKVQFVGVNVRDSAATALAFDKTFKITWPSIIDAQTGSVVLAFTGIVTPQAVPTTLVIGTDGKVSARVLGRIDKSILDTLIQTAVQE